jgi:hypothetical protein
MASPGCVQSTQSSLSKLSGAAIKPPTRIGTNRVGGGAPGVGSQLETIQDRNRVIISMSECATAASRSNLTCLHSSIWFPPKVSMRTDGTRDGYPSSPCNSRPRVARAVIFGRGSHPMVPDGNSIPGFEKPPLRAWCSASPLHQLTQRTDEPPPWTTRMPNAHL